MTGSVLPTLERAFKATPYTPPRHVLHCTTFHYSGTGPPPRPLYNITTKQNKTSNKSHAHAVWKHSSGKRNDRHSAGIWQIDGQIKIIIKQHSTPTLIDNGLEIAAILSAPHVLSAYCWADRKLRPTGCDSDWQCQPARYSQNACSCDIFTLLYCKRNSIAGGVMMSIKHTWGWETILAISARANAE